MTLEHASLMLTPCALDSIFSTCLANRLPEKKGTEIAYRAGKEGKAAAVKEFGCSYHAVSLALERDKENDENCPQMDRKRSGRPRLLSDRDDRHVK